MPVGMVQAPDWTVALTLALLTATLCALLLLRARSKRMEQLISVDELTGIANRREWRAHLMREMARARREHTELSVALLDLDHFKELNDRHGHETGDEVLREVAAAAERVLRDGDTIGRLGGDEFGILLTSCGIGAAYEALDRLRSEVRGGQGCSAGVVEWNSVEDEGGVLRRADHALYEAKAAGGNCTVMGLGARLELTLTPSLETPAAARELLRQLEGELEPETFAKLMLLVNELVTASVACGGGEVGVRVWLTPQVVRAEIDDPSRYAADLLRERELVPPDTDGWGVQLLDRVSHRWGTPAGSSQVWFELKR